MKRQSNFGLICSLVCAAGSFWFAVAELLGGVASVSRRVIRVFAWLAACAVWTANLVVELQERKTEAAAEADCID